MLPSFIENAKMVRDCQRGLFHCVFEQRPYVLIFKTTHYCWYNCAHCCESAGSRNQRNYIPQSVITGIIDQAVKDEAFSRALVFTGGELMSAYKYADKNYVSNIINHALSNGCGVDIKTNAGWVDFPFADQIFQDIEDIVKKHAEVDNDSGIKKLIPFQVSLSLDGFHKNALDKDMKFIEHFARTNIPGTAFHIHVSSFKQYRHMFSELLQRLAKSGIEISEMLGFSSNKEHETTMYSLNHNVVVNYSEATLFNGGRAKNIKSAYKTPFPEFTFINDDAESFVAFDSFGNVTLGENSGKKISTPWCNNDKSVKTLETIKSELSKNIRQTEQNFLQQHQKLNRCLAFAGNLFSK
jgi:organic radical activating enzyme